VFLLWVLSGSSNVANAALVNYRINASGNVLAFDNGVNYYNAFFNGSTGAYWAFDTNSNTYGTSTTGFNRTLQTNDFTVSDILDVTWTLNDQAWVKTTQGNYRIDAYGNVTALGNGINYYNAFLTALGALIGHSTPIQTLTVHRRRALTELYKPTTLRFPTY